MRACQSVSNHFQLLKHFKRFLPKLVYYMPLKDAPNFVVSSNNMADVRILKAIVTIFGREIMLVIQSGPKVDIQYIV